jgi:hypothetical protein
MATHDDSTATILFALGANAVIALAKGSVAWIRVHQEITWSGADNARQLGAI